MGGKSYGKRGESEKVQRGSEGTWKEINSSGPGGCMWEGLSLLWLVEKEFIIYYLLYLLHLYGQLGLNHHSLKAERNSTVGQV